MLLAVDTSTRLIGIALYNGVQVLSEAVWTSSDHHTVELAPAVEETMRRAGVKVSDLTVLAAATGPGSFTGLRIGLALVKGLALARRLPILGVPTLDALAASQPVEYEQLAAVLQAGRGRLALGWYQAEENHWKPFGEVSVVDAEALARQIKQPTQVCGELTEEERHTLSRKRKNVRLASPAQSLRRPSFLAELAWKRWQDGQVDDPQTLSPIYLHLNEPIPGA